MKLIFCHEGMDYYSPHPHRTPIDGLKPLIGVHRAEGTNNPDAYDFKSIMDLFFVHLKNY